MIVLTPAVGNLWSVGHMRPVKLFHPASVIEEIIWIEIPKIALFPPVFSVLESFQERAFNLKCVHVHMFSTYPMICFFFRCQVDRPTLHPSAPAPAPQPNFRTEWTWRSIKCNMSFWSAIFYIYFSVMVLLEKKEEKQKNLMCFIFQRLVFSVWWSQCFEILSGHIGALRRQVCVLLCWQWRVDIFVAWFHNSL